MALKKPSDLFKQKQTSGVFESLEVSSHINERYDEFVNNFEKVNKLSELVEVLSQKLSEKLTKTELETAMLSQLMVFDENFKKIQNEVKNLNKKDLKEFKDLFCDLTEIVDNLIENEIPKCKKQITKNELIFEKKVQQVQKVVEETIDSIRQEIDTNKKELQQETSNRLNTYQTEFKNVQEHLENSVESSLEDYRKELVEIKSEVVINEQHIKNIDKYLQEYHQDLVQIKEEVFSEIENLLIGDFHKNIERLEKKIDFIKETYSQIEPEIIIKEVIQESNFTEPPEIKNGDPLTPLNQNFVTLDQLQQHYRLFINRIQQQISTLGGGGETQLKYLDDIVGIATNPSAYDGKYLKYNHSLGKFEFVTVSGGGESYWISGASGISTSSNVGIGSTVPTAKLDVLGNVNISGVVTAFSFSGNASTATYATSSGVSTNLIGGIGSITQLSVTGISTFTNGPVLIGAATFTETASQPLQVTGGAYISGSVGVGTTNPQYKLDIGGDLNFTGTLYQNGVVFSGGGGGSSSQWVTTTAGIHTLSNVGIGTTNPQVKLDVLGGNRFGGLFERVSIATTYLSASAVVLELDCQQATTYTYTLPESTNIGIVSFRNMLAQTGTANATTVTVLFTQNTNGTGNTTASTGIGTNITVVGYENGASVSPVSEVALVGSGTTITLSQIGSDIDFVSFYVYYNGGSNTSSSSYRVFATRNGNFR